MNEYNAEVIHLIGEQRFVINVKEAQANLSHELFDDKVIPTGIKM